MHPEPIARGAARCAALVLACFAGPSLGAGESLPRFELDPGWVERFWSPSEVEGLLELSPVELAGLVPTQAGFRFCRCPACGAAERDEALVWSVADPSRMACRICRVKIPNDQIPAHPEGDPTKPIPEDTIEVRAGVLQHYPYHLMEARHARYPGERVYIEAHRDGAARAFLAKFALYAAVRGRDESDVRASRAAAALIVRFAQVYPDYATHYDQADQPKYLQRAELRPPYRQGFRTGRWDWSGALNVPLDLLVAYAIVGETEAFASASEALGVSDARRVVEEEFLRPAAEFLLGHPDPSNELSIHAARGLLATGRLLGDERFAAAGLRMLDGVALRGFYHDGVWHEPDAAAHRRVAALMDGWFRQLLPFPANLPPLPPEELASSRNDAPGRRALAMFELARRAAGGVRRASDDVRLASLPSGSGGGASSKSGPMLLGGAGVARLEVGEGTPAIRVELNGRGTGAGSAHGRLGLRVAFGGKDVLGDWRDRPASVDGWEQSTVSHSLVAIDGLNQRETIESALRSAPGADLHSYAADSDFQVVAMADRFAYPRSSRLDRRTVIAVADAAVRYVVVIDEVDGGRQQDQIWHSAPGLGGNWTATAPLRRGLESLLPPSVPYLAETRAEDGRWFVQAYGMLDDLLIGPAAGPTFATLSDESVGLVRLHRLDFDHADLILAQAPGEVIGRRGTLLWRKRAVGPSAILQGRWVTLIEPLAPESGIIRVGRIEAADGVVLLRIETAAGIEHLVFNPSPGVERSLALPDGETLRTDALVLRSTAGGLIAAGGTLAEHAGRLLRMERPAGAVIAAVARPSIGSRGWFVVDGSIGDLDACAGRSLLIRHGDGRVRGWTIVRAEALGDRMRLHVLEEPAFSIDPVSNESMDYQFPGLRSAGPHEYRIDVIGRTVGPAG